MSQDQVLKYLKTISAFANCSGGRIVFGVDSDLSVCGMDAPFAARDRIADAIANGTISLEMLRLSFTSIRKTGLRFQTLVDCTEGPSLTTFLL